MIKLITTTLALTILSGCSMISTMPIASEKFTELNGKTLAVTTPLENGLAVLTLGGAMVGGLTVFNAEEDDLYTFYKLQDPAIRISKAVEEKLVKKSKMKIKQHKPLSIRSQDPLEIASQFEGVDYILDINTLSMRFSYRLTDFTSYQVTYLAKLQLVESKTKSVIAESICKIETDEDISLSYDDFLENDAKLLKAEFQRAASLCTAEFSKDILRL